MPAQLTITRMVAGQAVVLTVSDFHNVFVWHTLQFLDEIESEKQQKDFVSFMNFETDARIISVSDANELYSVGDIVRVESKELSAEIYHKTDWASIFKNASAIGESK